MLTWCEIPRRSPDVPAAGAMPTQEAVRGVRQSLDITTRLHQCRAPSARSLAHLLISNLGQSLPTLRDAGEEFELPERRRCNSLGNVASGFPDACHFSPTIATSNHRVGCDVRGAFGTSYSLNCRRPKEKATIGWFNQTRRWARLLWIVSPADSQTRWTTACPTKPVCSCDRLGARRGTLHG